LIFLKSVVVVLLLANVGYFLWERDIAQAPEAKDPRPQLAVLQLVSESAPGQPSVPPGSDGVRIAASGGGEAMAAAALDPNDLQRCRSVGPFRDVAEAARAAAMLRGSGYEPRQRMAEGEVWAGVWVYLPHPATRGAAEQTLAKLKAGGVDDALEMPGPNDASVISLGLYSEPKRAQARVSLAQALGLKPAIADRKRIGDVYWIDVDLKSADKALNPADFKGEAGHIVRLEVTGCPPQKTAAP
jgi:hypothetical protein